MKTEKLRTNCTLLFSHDGMNIRIQDQDSRVVIEMSFSAENTCKILSRLGNVEADKCEVQGGIENIGKKRENKTITCPIPKEVVNSRDRKEQAKRIVEETLLFRTTDPGWIVSDSFNSQDSFTSKDGEHFVNANIIRWIEKKD